MQFFDIVFSYFNLIWGETPKNLYLEEIFVAMTMNVYSFFFAQGC